MKGKKRIIPIVTTVLFVLGVMIVLHFYFDSVNRTIFNESSSHLNEIYQQTNQSFSTLMDNTWSSLHSWEPYLRETEDDEKSRNTLRNCNRRVSLPTFISSTATGIISP